MPVLLIAALAYGWRNDALGPDIFVTAIVSATLVLSLVALLLVILGATL